MELKKNKKKNTWRLFFLNRNISQTLITPPAQRLTREALALFIFKLVLPVTPSIQHNQREQRLQRYTVFPLGFFFSLVSYIAGILANPWHTDRITCWDTDQTLHPGFTYWSITDTHTHMKRTHSHTHTLVLTGVKEDHGLEADVLLPLELELSHSGRGSYQHIKDLHKALDAAPLFSAIQRHKTRPVVYQETAPDFCLTKLGRCDILGEKKNTLRGVNTEIRKYGNEAVVVRQLALKGGEWICWTSELHSPLLTRQVSLKGCTESRRFQWWRVHSLIFEVLVPPLLYSLHFFFHVRYLYSISSSFFRWTCMMSFKYNDKIWCIVKD